MRRCVVPRADGFVAPSSPCRSTPAQRADAPWKPLHGASVAPPRHALPGRSRLPRPNRTPLDQTPPSAKRASVGPAARKRPSEARSTEPRKTRPCSHRRVHLGQTHSGRTHLRRPNARTSARLRGRGRAKRDSPSHERHDTARSARHGTAPRRAAPHETARPGEARQGMSSTSPNGMIAARYRSTSSRQPNPSVYSCS